MEVSPWALYLIYKLDDIRAACFFVSFVSVFVFLCASVPLLEGYFLNHKQRNICKAIMCLFGIITLLSFIFLIALPSTFEAEKLFNVENSNDTFLRMLR